MLGFTAVTPKTADNDARDPGLLLDLALAWRDQAFLPALCARLSWPRTGELWNCRTRGLNSTPPQMLIQDGDVPAIWYHRLKKAWAESVETGKPFAESGQERTLRWRS